MGFKEFDEGTGLRGPGWHETVLAWLDCLEQTGMRVAMPIGARISDSASMGSICRTASAGDEKTKSPGSSRSTMSISRRQTHSRLIYGAVGAAGNTM